MCFSDGTGIAPPGGRTRGSEENQMACPYLEEVVMVFCRAYPVRKMVPRDRITSASRCLGEDFQSCPLFRELMDRRVLAEQEAAASPRGPAAGEEGAV